MAPEQRDLSWDEVYNLVAFDTVLDPLSSSPTVRWGAWRRSIPAQITIYLAVGGVLLSAVDLLRDPSPRWFLLVGGTPELSRHVGAAIGNPTAYLALLVGGATIFFTFRQIRAKVRADSRQQWIIHARRLLGEVIALVDAHRDLRDSNRFKAAEEVWKALNPLRVELELMLNPSEKDHRLLLFLIQRFSRWRDVDREPQDARIVRSSIAGSASEPDEKWAPILDSACRSEMVSYILRLAHVVLKREWERVKHTR